MVIVNSPAYFVRMAEAICLEEIRIVEEEVMVKKVMGLMLLVALLGFSLESVFAGESATTPAEVPVKDTVTMVDLGADQCIPCKMMTPILKELEGKYKGKAAIVFIDVWKNPDEGRKYGIGAIPTQIFYDKEGKEFFRHEGFLDKESIIHILEKMGVEKVNSEG